MTEMILSTTSILDQNKYEVIKMVSGIQVKSLSMLRSYLGSWAGIFGTGKDDWTGITKIFKSTKEEALDIMKQEASSLGANEIIGVRINVSQISEGKNSMLVCSCEGTAVRVIARGGKRTSRTRKRKK